MPGPPKCENNNTNVMGLLFTQITRKLLEKKRDEVKAGRSEGGRDD